jgi:hypothetical protein
VEKQNKVCLAKFYEKNAATSKEKKENNATAFIQANEKKKENNATSFIQANEKKKEKKKENDASTLQLLQANERLKKKKENIARVKERIEKEKKKKMTTNLDQLQQRIPNISIIPIVQLIENQPSEPVLENKTKNDSLHSTNFTFSFKEKVVGDYFGLEINQTIWKSCMYPPLLELTIFGDSDCNLGKNKNGINFFKKYSGE